MSGEFVAHLAIGRPQLGDYAWSYRQAAHVLLREARSSAHLLDELALPMLYLFRHAFELAIKDVVVWASFLSVNGQAVQIPALDTHSLLRLESLLNGSLTPLRSANGSARLGRYEDVIPPAVSWLTALDVDGQRLRYPELSRGRGPSWRDLQQQAIDVQPLQDLVDPALAYLILDLGPWLDGLAEIAREDAAIAELWTEAMWRRAVTAQWDSEPFGDLDIQSEVKAEHSIALLDISRSRLEESE